MRDTAGQSTAEPPRFRNRLHLMQSRRPVSISGRATSYKPLDHYTPPPCDPFVAHPLMRRAAVLCGRASE